ncbi:MAG TPA: DNA repair protein RadA [Patescibacteria group bacterium]|nr:DNA repair protein RadA [Patescibacteria group bacterium]
MPKTKSTYICQSCGYNSSEWLGKCPECQSWNSLVETLEEVPSTAGFARTGGTPRTPQPLSSLTKSNLKRLPTGMSELDRVLGGGVVPGSVVLISGDPGIGKSTLLLQLGANLGGLYIAGEESADQIKLRADRLGLKAPSLDVLSETDVDGAVATILSVKPRLVIADSVQTLATSDLSSSAGSVGQIRESASRLIRVAKESGIPVFLVGHVTKEGAIAGPKILEHLVDTVLYLEGDSQHVFRIVRTTKNRFGPTDEIGVFEMTSQGMLEVKDPSSAFLAERVDAPGSVVVPTMEGSRPVLVEIQALTTASGIGIPRRSALGVDYNRVQLLTAVLQKRAGIQLHSQDVFVNVAGGIRINEPAVDLAICLAIASSTLGRPLKPGLTAIGEVGLLGEIRQVRFQEKRAVEARKRGYKLVLSPDKVRTLRQAIEVALAPKEEIL